MFLSYNGQYWHNNINWPWPILVSGHSSEQECYPKYYIFSYSVEITFKYWQFLFLLNIEKMYGSWHILGKN